MNKFYIRFNPQHAKDVLALPWQVLCITDTGTQRHLAKEVHIEVNTWTEKSFEDGGNWWSIACAGKLFIEDKVFRIVSENTP